MKLWDNMSIEARVVLSLAAAYIGGLALACVLGGVL